MHWTANSLLAILMFFIWNPLSKGVKQMFSSANLVDMERVWIATFLHISESYIKEQSDN